MQIKPAPLCLLPLILLFMAGCLTPSADFKHKFYVNIKFEKAYFPGTENLSVNETAIVQTVGPTLKRVPDIAVYSVDGRPVLCKIANFTGKLLETLFASKTDASALISRPISLFCVSFIHPHPYENWPLLMQQTLTLVTHRQLILPPGEHELELAVITQGSRSPGVTQKEKFQAGKTYVISTEGIKKGEKAFRYVFTALD